MYILFLFAERSMKHSRFFWWFVLFWTSLHENWFGTCWNIDIYLLPRLIPHTFIWKFCVYIFISQHYQDLAIDLVTSGPVKIAALSSWLCSISQEIDHVFRHRCLDQRKEEIYTNNDKDMLFFINLNWSDYNFSNYAGQEDQPNQPKYFR